jgi:hypothetical protein
MMRATIIILILSFMFVVGTKAQNSKNVDKKAQSFNKIEQKDKKVKYTIKTHTDKNIIAENRISKYKQPKKTKLTKLTNCKKTNNRTFVYSQNLMFLKSYKVRD